jgi:hypothetical protein
MATHLKQLSETLEHVMFIMLSMLFIPVSGRDDELRPGGETLHGRGSAMFVSGELAVRGSGDSAPTPDPLAPRGSPPLAVSLSHLRVCSSKTLRLITLLLSHFVALELVITHSSFCNCLSG